MVHYEIGEDKYAVDWSSAVGRTPFSGAWRVNGTLGQVAGEGQLAGGGSLPWLGSGG